MAQARRDAPLQSSRLDQQDARRSARPTQRLPGNTSRSRTTGGLKLHQAVGIQRRVRWRFLDHHLIQGHFQLLGDHHGNTGLRTLAHFNFRRDHRDHAIGANADKGTVTLRGVITKPTCRSRLGGCALATSGGSQVLNTKPLRAIPLPCKRRRRDISTVTSLGFFISRLLNLANTVNGRANPGVSGAAAQIARHGGVNCLIIGLRLALQQRRGGHDLP